MPNPATVYSASRATPRMDRKIEQILKILSIHKLTANGLSEKLHSAPDTARFYLNMLYKQRRVYVSGWKAVEGQKAARMYSAGKKPDVLFTSRKVRKVDTRIADRKEQVLKALVLPQTTAQVADMLDMSYPNARKIIDLLKKDSSVYIKAYVMTHALGMKAAVYAVGDLPYAELTSDRRLPPSKRKMSAPKRDVFASMVQA